MSIEKIYLTILRTEYQKRVEKNSRYSMRSFARSAGLDPSTLVRIFSGKRIPSLKHARTLLEFLQLDELDETQFLKSLAVAQRSRKLLRINPAFRKLEDVNLDFHQTEIAQNIASAISEWYYAVILELIACEGFQPNIKWISDKVGISVELAQLAVNRLIYFKFIEIHNDGTWLRCQPQLTSSNKNLTSSALKKNQKQLLEKAITSLEFDPIEIRSITSMTMAIDPERIEYAKEMIRTFNREMSRNLEAGRSCQVFNLEIALYPLSKKTVNESCRGKAIKTKKNLNQKSSQKINQSFNQASNQSKKGVVNEVQY